jgi:hypothetical protein
VGECIVLYDHGSTAEVSAAEMAAARITPALDAEGGTGATALLHGILATLSESLERLDRRLVALESATEGRLTRMEEGVSALTDALRAATEAEADVGPDEGRDEARDELLHALDATAGRLEARLEEVRDAMPVPDPEEGVATRAVLRDEIDRWGRSLHDEIERLGVLVRGQVAEVSGQAASVAAVLGRLDGRLHDLVEGVRVTAQQARALRREPEGAPETFSLS